MSDEETIDPGFNYPDFLCQNDEIDRMIEERAGAFNLTGTNIRNILYHVVLGVGGARDFWEDEDEFVAPLETPEPKTRAAKQKLQGHSVQNNVPLLTLPEVRSPEHEDEDDDQDYNPQQDTECSDDSDDEQESLAPTTPKPSFQTPTRTAKVSECDSHPNTPSVGLAKRTRSLFSLKDKELIELELDLKTVDDEEEKEETKENLNPAKSTEENLDESQDDLVEMADNRLVEEEQEEEEEEEDEEEEEENWEGLEEELENEFDNLLDSDDSSQSEEDVEDDDDAAADDGTFGQFLAGIANPKEEFPEDDTSVRDLPYVFRERVCFEAEEFRTDKEVVVTKREIGELLRELDKIDPAVKRELNPRRTANCKPLPVEETVTIIDVGPLFTPASVDILKEQLQMHLQLLVQHSILAADVESLQENRTIACKRIEELEDLCSQCSTEGLIQAMEGIPETNHSILKCLDIYPALRLASSEKYVPDVSPSQSIPLKVAREVSGIKHVEPLPRKKYYLLNYQPFFHRFLHIRPTVNFICRTKRKFPRCFSELEDNLLAHGLDAFQYVSEQKAVYDAIHGYFLPTKTIKQIANRVKNRVSNAAPYNVIKHWRETGRIRYDTQYTTNKLMKSLSIPVVSSETLPIAPAISVHNLDWLKALREHRRKLQREYSKKKQRFLCTKESVVSVAKLMTVEESHSFEIAFMLKAKEMLKNDSKTYFNMFKTLAEFNLVKQFDCEEVIGKILVVLKNYPDLGFEFLSIFSPLPDMPVNQLLETLSHIKTRVLLRNLERHFKSNPHQYKKVIRLILGANLNNPTVTRDTLMNMLRGKPELSSQIAEFFDKCAVRPKAHEFEYIDLTDKNAVNCTENKDGFEEIFLLERNSVSAQKHNKLIESINKFHDDQRKQEEDEKIAKKLREEEEKRLRKIEKRKMPAKNIVECGDKVVTWTRDQDRDILKGCRSMGPRSKTFKSLAKSFPGKNDTQVRDRYYTLMQLMKKARKAAERKAQLHLKQKAAEKLAKKAAKTPTKKAAAKTPTKSAQKTTKNSSKRPRLAQDEQPGPSSGYVS